MAKLIGPCLSLSASGSINKTISFQKRPSGFCGLKKTVPFDPKTINMQRSRVISQLGRSKWKQLSVEQQQDWHDSAQGLPRAGYHLFISQWLSRYLNSLIPFITPDQLLFWPQRIIIGITS